MKRRFTPDQVRQIREDYAAGVRTLEQLADWYYCHTTTIWKIVTLQSYRDVV